MCPCMTFYVFITLLRVFLHTVGTTLLFDSLRFMIADVAMKYGNYMYLMLLTKPETADVCRGHYQEIIA